MSKLPKYFYVDKNPDNVKALEEKGFIIQGVINYNDDSCQVLYVNNSKKQSGVIQPNHFIETVLNREDKYKKLDYISTDNYIDLYYLEVYCKPEFKVHVWADSPLEAINKWSQKTGLKDFTMVTCRRVCNKSEIIL